MATLGGHCHNRIGPFEGSAMLDPPSLDRFGWIDSDSWWIQLYSDRAEELTSLVFIRRYALTSIDSMRAY